MNYSWSKTLACGLLPVAGLLACTDRTASTEVENELQTVALTGIAATGAACALSSVAMYAPSGELIARDTTDSAGVFLATVKLDKALLPLLVRVQTDSTILYTLLMDTTANQTADTLFALANPLTSLVTRQQLGAALSQPANGFTAPPLDSIRAIGERAMSRLFGTKVAWNDFYHDHDFQPYEPSHPEKGAGPNDALLHTLGDEARRLGLGIDAYLDSLYQNPPAKKLLEQEFRFQVASNMVMLGVDSLQATEQIREWQPDSTEMEGYYQALRNNQHNGPPPVDSLEANQGTARRATDEALLLVAQIYTGTATYDSAMNNLSALARTVFLSTDEALSPLRDDGISPETMDSLYPLALEIAKQAVQTLVHYSPAQWASDGPRLQGIAKSVIAATVTDDFDLIAYAQSADPAAYFAAHYVAPTEAEREAAIAEAEAAASLDTPDETITTGSSASAPSSSSAE
jgi:hypothetical protein